MSQDIWSSINPDTTSGTMLAALLTDFKDAIMSGFSGSSRPSNLQAGGVWLDTSNQTAPDYYWSFKLWDGTTDNEVFRISVLRGFGGTLFADGTFTVKEVAEDTAGAILNLIKQRVDTNGQVLSGDTVAELRLVGRTDTSTDPVVAYFKFTATDDNTTTAYGGTLSMYSTPDASATIAEHLRFISGTVEFVAPWKLNALRLVSQNVATAAGITQLNADYSLVEMTGSTDTDIRGINSAGNAKQIYIHNRSSATVTLKHENGTATAADRLKLPSSLDVALAADETAGLFYCTTDSRWKLMEATGHKLTKTIETLNGVTQTWTAPAGYSRIKVTAFKRRGLELTEPGVIDKFGNQWAWGGFNNRGRLGIGNATTSITSATILAGFASSSAPSFSGASIHNRGAAFGENNYGVDQLGRAWAWGRNASGEIGDGTVAGKSSPTLVSGSLKVVLLATCSDLGNAFALTESGDMYGWGTNGGGSASYIGTGDSGSTNYTSPQLVLGGQKFARFATNGVISLALTKTGAAYAWGENTSGLLGDGTRTARSSPVAVTGGLTFKRVTVGANSMYGISTNGNTYAWGSNSFGQLGVGDTTNRSSPVLVLGGLTFVEIFASAGGSSAFGMTSDGTLYAWGYNINGQLGVGDTTSRSSPVAVLGGLKFKYVSADFSEPSSVFGITEDGTAYAWGLNDDGQLGVGNVTPRSSPVAVLGGLKFTAIKSRNDGNGDTSTIGCTLEGQVYAWGGGSGYALGTTPQIASSPVVVIGAVLAPSAFNHRYISETYIEVSAGSSYTVRLAEGMSYFGNTPLGTNVDHVTIEYHK